MREVINISLPSTMAKTVKNAVKNGAYASTSEFFRALVRDWQESKLLAEIEESRRDIAAGKGQILRSLKDLR